MAPWKSIFPSRRAQPYYFGWNYSIYSNHPQFVVPAAMINSGGAGTITSTSIQHARFRVRLD